MVRVVLIFLLFINSSFAKAESLSFDIRCFSSEGGRINIQLATAYIAEGKLSIGYVRYEKADTSIPIFFSGETERVLDKDRPFEVEATWKEVVNSKIKGEYAVASQGANVYGLRYTSGSGKITNFRYNEIATKSDYSGCKWVQ